MILDGVSYVDESRCCEISVETRFPLTHTGILSKSRVVLGCERQRKTNTAPEHKMRSKGAYGFSTGHSGLIKTFRPKSFSYFMFGTYLVRNGFGMMRACLKLNLFLPIPRKATASRSQAALEYSHPRKKQRKIQPTQDPGRSLIEAASSHYMCPFA